jgi:hypothetical protein
MFGVMTGLGLDDPDFSFTQPLIHRYRDFFPQVRKRLVYRTDHSVPRMGMSEYIPLLPLYAFVV